MKNKLLIFAILVAPLLSGQNEKEVLAIVEEGKKLYKSEMTSWYGTDIFLANNKGQEENIGGYFSYVGENTSKCVFFSKESNPRVLGTITFDTGFDVKSALYDNSKREFTEYEKDIFIIRQKALSEINSDSLFKFYKGTNLNLIPVVDQKEKKVFILTGPKDNGVVLFGNDYLIEFDKDNNIINKKQLHKSLIAANLPKQSDEGKRQTAGIHSHVISDYITSTDICTLMLYEKYTTWEEYYVMSGKYISIWNCKTNELSVLTKEAWDKINKDKKK